MPILRDAEWDYGEDAEDDWGYEVDGDGDGYFDCGDGDDFKYEEEKDTYGMCWWWWWW